ncbi:GNAT family N-acetyltransferase [Methylococcaceae bacterium WWC4]|nr:GNAT family N-acetyltransferase [Methylococcaceae bacterium WWC4]
MIDGKIELNQPRTSNVDDSTQATFVGSGAICRINPAPISGGLSSLRVLRIRLARLGRLTIQRESALCSLSVWDDLVVKGKRQNQGIGKRLIEYAKQAAQFANCNNLVLDTRLYTCR